jgi:hypothetical protein
MIHNPIEIDDNDENMIVFKEMLDLLNFFYNAFQ